MSFGEERERWQRETSPQNRTCRSLMEKWTFKVLRTAWTCFAATAAGLWELQEQGPGYSVSKGPMPALDALNGQAGRCCPGFGQPAACSLWQAGVLEGSRNVLTAAAGCYLILALQ